MQKNSYQAMFRMAGLLVHNTRSKTSIKESIKLLLELTEGTNNKDTANRQHAGRRIKKASLKLFFIRFYGLTGQKTTFLLISVQSTLWPQKSNGCVSRMLAVWQVGFLLMSCAEMLLWGMSMSVSPAPNTQKSPFLLVTSDITESEPVHIGVSSHSLQEGETCCLSARGTST